MNKAPYERNREIYEKVKNGMTQSATAKEYSLSVARVNQICNEQERRERHSYINEQFAEQYPEDNARAISITVNALIRYWSRNGYLTSYLDGKRINIEQFIRLVKETKRRGELMYVRGLGANGIIFLKKVLEDEKI